MMVRKNFYLTKAQEDFLEGLDGLSVSEHLRRAIDDYMLKKTREFFNASSSPSKTKGGTYGREINQSSPSKGQ